MNDPAVEFLVLWRKLSPLEVNTNSVTIMIETKANEIQENQTTGHRILTGRSNPVSPLVHINIDLRSTSFPYILQLLQDRLVNHHWLCQNLALEISTTATELGFGRNGFLMEIFVAVTYETVVAMSDPPPPPPSNHDALSLKIVILRMVLLGRIGSEELKSLNMETESCSICLDNLCASTSLKPYVPTRMTCSHVFHDSCLLEWLQRKNTCPLCRTVLYHR